MTYGIVLNERCQGHTTIWQPYFKVRNIITWSLFLFHSRQSQSPQHFLDSGKFRRYQVMSRDGQWKKRIFSNTVLQAPPLKQHIKDRPQHHLRELILQERKKKKNPHSYTFSPSDSNMWCSMHNLLFWCIHPQSQLTTTFKFLHIPQWLSTRPGEMGSLYCTLLHTVRVGGSSESNRGSVSNFLVKKKGELNRRSCVSCTVQSTKKDIKEVVVLYIQLTTDPWK